MSPSSFSSRDRRAIILGGATLVAALGWSGGVWPFVRALAVRRDAVERERELLARERGLIAQQGTLAAALRAASTARAAEETRAIHADNEATAGVILADYVRGLARAHEVAVDQATELPPDSLASGVRLLRLQVRGESDFAGVLRFLRALETGAVHARVAQLDVGRRTGRADAESREVLSVTAMIEAPLARADVQSEAQQAPMPGRGRLPGKGRSGAR